MHAPTWLTKELVRRHPEYRLAWAGRPAEADELNAGDFALVQLYPISRVGSLTDPDIFEELWDVTTRADEYGRVLRVRANRGPIFNAKGGTRPDWDPLFRIPVYKFDFGEQGIDLYKFFGGGWLNTLSRALRGKALLEAQDREAERKGKALIKKVDDQAAAGYQYLKGMKDADSGRPEPVAYKHAKGELKKFYDKKEKRRQALLDYFKVRR
jgi:hypothetical protein